jgi:hypothetical protein
MSYETLNPATGEVIKTFAQISDAEVFAALKTADDRYHNDWRFRPVTERAKILPEAPGSVVVTEPLGVIVAVEPWNFPYSRSSTKTGSLRTRWLCAVVGFSNNLQAVPMVISNRFGQEIERIMCELHRHTFSSAGAYSRSILPFIRLYNRTQGRRYLFNRRLAQRKCDFKSIRRHH